MNCIPEYAYKIIDTITSAGYEAYLVGGCVRDALLGIESHDIDITTSALPDTVIDLFDNAIYTGKKYGTVTVYVDNGKAEVTTFRTEQGYSDYRRPDNVRFTDNLYDDLKRRDFTVNSICRNRETVIDFFNGTDDIKNHIIKCIGEPDDRFSEDPLRILRACRLSASLGFEIDKLTNDSIIRNCNLLRRISVERIRDELLRISYFGRIDVLIPLLKNGALENIGLIYSPAIESINLLAQDNISNFAILMYLCGESAIDNLRLSNEIADKIKQIISIIKDFPKENKFDIKKVISCCSLDTFKYSCYAYNRLYKKNTDGHLKLLNEIINNNEPYRLNQLKIDGNDLLALNMSPLDIGSILNRLLLLVIEKPELNNHESLVSEVMKLNA